MTDTPLSTVQSRVTRIHAHARTCKADPSRCPDCVDNRRYMDSLPLTTLARVLQDTTEPTRQIR